MRQRASPVLLRPRMALAFAAAAAVFGAPPADAQITSSFASSFGAPPGAASFGAPPARAEETPRPSVVEPAPPVMQRRLEVTTTTTTTTAVPQTEAQQKESALREAQEAAAQAQLTLNQNFFAAAENRDLSSVTSLLSQRADINFNGPQGPILFTLAMKASKDDTQIADFTKSLISLGADIDYTDGRGRTALFMAAYGAKHPALVKAYKDAVNKNPHKGYRVTALALAARDGHLEVAKALLEINADPNKGDDRGNTAMREAEDSTDNAMRAAFGLPPATTTTTTTTTTSSEKARRMSDL